ncbi:hypothetical protein [Elizabethkingia anophelis]|uniref:hypothetical protein n=1 Tax=Elizabethkingia anophelis TaxID=1117645 RepID=UPI0016249BAE|nr:hypothetical protein [Elizabethkingia anophelis]
MKTKYIAVPVSERLPEERVDVIIIDEYGDKGEGFVLPDNDWMVYSDSVTGSIEYWLEPVPDHSEEMLSMLQRILDLNILPAEIDDEVISLTLKAQGYNMNKINEISQNGFELTKQLINKVKDNG